MASLRYILEAPLQSSSETIFPDLDQIYGRLCTMPLLLINIVRRKLLLKPILKACPNASAKLQRSDLIIRFLTALLE